MAEKLSAAQQKAVDWIQGHRAEELGSLGIEVGKMLAELTVELLDATREAAHWKASFETVRDEMKLAIATVIAKGPGARKRLIITRAQYGKAIGKQLMVTRPDEETVIYELVEKTDEHPDNSNEHGRLIRPN